MTALTAAAPTALGAGASNAGVLTPSADRASSAGHWCRQGDPPIYASAQATCRLAGRTVTDYVNVCHESRVCRLVVIASTGRTRYRIACHRSGTIRDGTVHCASVPDTRIRLRFAAEV